MTRFRLGVIAILLGVVSSAAAAAPAATAASKPTTLPTLYVKYAMNCTFTIVDDFGRPVTQIPPGTYQVQVSTPTMFKLVVPAGADQPDSNDFTACKGWVQFQLTGPDVTLFTTLDTGCDAYQTLPAATFKPNATYTAVDLNQPAATQTTFTTAAAGTPQLPASPYSAGPGKGELSTDIVGSDLKARTTVAGTLDARLAKSGTLTLTRKGRLVSVLKAGRYTFSINNQDPDGSITLKPLGGGKSTVLAAAGSISNQTTTITLKPGRYTLFSRNGATDHFLVTS